MDGKRHGQSDASTHHIKVLTQAGALAIAIALTSCGGGNQSSTSPPPPSQTVAVSVSPSSANVVLGNTQQFTATVTGSSNTAVNWSVNGTSGGNSTIGTISSGGLYTAPADLPSQTAISITATSQADNSKNSTASVSITSDVSLTVGTNPPNTSSLVSGGNVQLGATLTSAGHPDPSLTWSVDGVSNGSTAVGTIASNGQSALFTAPPSVPSPATVTIQATSVADRSKSASVRLAIESGIQVSLSPMISSILFGKTQQFAASVTGTTNTAVGWFVNNIPNGNSGVGTITQTGLDVATYTTPTTVSTSPLAVTVVAQSLADPSKSASVLFNVVGVTTIFSDDFSGPFPGTNWIIVNGSPTINTTIGNPAPSLELPARSSQVGFGGTIQSAVNPFSTAGGLTISADTVGPSGGSSGGTNFTVFLIEDRNTLGTAGYTSAQAVIYNGAVTYFFSPNGPSAGITQPINPDNNFHTYTLQIDAYGTATWFRDGVQQVSGTGFSSKALTITVSGGTSSGAAYLDNVKVVGPPIMVNVVPSSATVQTGSTAQFTATVTGPSNTVTWSIDGIPGGDSTVGTISPAGLYTAPAVPPSPSTVIVQAASVVDPAKAGTALVGIIGVITSASQSITASQGGTITLVDGSSVTIPLGVLSSDQTVTVSLVSALSQQPPDQLIAGVGPGLILSLSVPNPTAAKLNTESLPDFANSSFQASTSSPDLQFSINVSQGTVSGLEGSAPMANVVDTSGTQNFIGTNGSYDSTTKIAHIAVPSSLLSHVTAVSTSMANWVLGLPPPNGPRVFDGTKWAQFSCSAVKGPKVQVLVHGMLSSVEGAFADNNGNSCVSAIQTAGNYDGVVGYDYDWTQDINQSGSQLATFLDTVAQCPGVQQVDIEAHSEGVPVALSAATQSTPQTQQIIKNFVSLGGPIMGTPVANSGPLPLGSVLLNLPGVSPGITIASGGRLFQNTLTTAPFLGGLTPDNPEMQTVRTNFANLLPNVKVIAVAGTVPDWSPKILTQLAPLFPNESFDNVIGSNSACGVNSGLPSSSCSLAPVTHTKLECNPNVIATVGQQVNPTPNPPPPPTNLIWNVGGTVTIDGSTGGFSGSVTLPLSGGSGSFGSGGAAITVNVSGSVFSLSGAGSGSSPGGSCQGGAGGSSAITESSSAYYAAGPLAGVLHCIFSDGSTQDYPITGSFSAGAQK